MPMIANGHYISHEHISDPRTDTWIQSASDLDLQPMHFGVP